MDTAIEVKIVDEIVYISPSVNTPGKSMNPIIHHPSLGK